MNQLTKILIIDDELIVRNGIKYLCNWEDHGFTIVGEATNGMEGLRLIEEFNPDIVITDIIMSSMDGIQLTQRIKESYPSIKIIILSGYDNFDYVKTLFKLGVDDYLLKSSLEQDDLPFLLERLRGGGHVVRTSASQFFQKLLVGSNLTHDECLIEFNERIVYFAEKVPYVLLAGRGGQNAFPDAVIENFQQFPHTACVSEDGLMCVLIQAKGGDIAGIYNATEAFIVSTNCPAAEQVLFAAVEPFDSLEKLFQRYNACIELLDYGFYYPEKTLLRREHIKNQTVDFPREKYLRTLNPIDLSEALKVLCQYLQNTAKQASLDVFSLKRQFEEAIYDLIQELMRAGFPVEDINRNKVTFFKQIESSQDYHALDKVLGDIFQIFEVNLSNDIRVREQDLFIRVRAHIDENCHQDLKLSDIAKTFHLNYTYLSTLFYQRTNQHFSHYLSNARIEKAKHMLQNKKNSIQVVSGEVGFTSQSYFAKVFRKHVGMSPMQYQTIYHRKQ